MDLDNVGVTQLNDVLEFSPEIGKSLFIPSHNALDGVVIARLTVDAATD